jgi:hypothetical protein
LAGKQYRRNGGREDKRYYRNMEKLNFLALWMDHKLAGMGIKSR